jgi:hypothetical protein
MDRLVEAQKNLIKIIEEERAKIIAEQAKLKQEIEVWKKTEKKLEATQVTFIATMNYNIRHSNRLSNISLRKAQVTKLSDLHTI